MRCGCYGFRLVGGEGVGSKGGVVVVCISGGDGLLWVGGWVGRMGNLFFTSFEVLDVRTSIRYRK